VAEAVAVFETLPVESALTVIVNVAMPLGAMLLPEQVTVLLEFEHPAEADTKVTPAGRMSVIETPVAVSGPALVTWIE